MTEERARALEALYQAIVEGRGMLQQLHDRASGLLQRTALDKILKALGEVERS